MVAKMYDISASTKRPGDHILPRVLRWCYRNVQGSVEGLFTRLYLTYKGAEGDRIFADRDRGLYSKKTSILLGGRDGFKSYFEGIGTVSVGEGPSREPTESFGIKLPRIYPEGLTEEVDSGSDFLNESIEGFYFGVRGEIEGNRDRTDHVGHKIS